MATIVKNNKNPKSIVSNQSLKERVAQRISSEEPIRLSYTALVPQEITCSPIVDAMHEPFFKKVADLWFKPKHFEKTVKYMKLLGSNT